MITLPQLKQICPTTKMAQLALYVDPLNAAMAAYEINTREREAAFLAQCAHESMGFHCMAELASGSAYEGRADLGNTEPGDGKRFKGHGFLQCTGRANHQAYADFKGITLDEAVEFIQTIDGAADVSGWFWQVHKLNELADSGDFYRITKKINGGTNGLAEREAYLARAQAVLA